MVTLRSLRRPSSALLVLAVLVAAVLGVVAAAPKPAAAADPITRTGSTTAAANAGSLDRAPAASNGSKVLTVWGLADSSGTTHVWGSVISLDGSSASAPFHISQRAQDEHDPDVAWNGSSWLVVWTHSFSSTDGDIRGQRVSSAGALIGSEVPIATALSNAYSPAIAARNGGPFEVVWSDGRNVGTTGRNIFGAQVKANGVVGSHVQLSSGFQQTDDDWPDVVWSASPKRFTVVFVRERNTLYKSLVGSTGALLAGGSVATDDFTNFSEPKLASDGTGVLVVWDNDDDVRGAWIDPAAATSGSPFPIAGGTTYQVKPAVAFNGLYLVVWQESPGPFSGQPLIRGARIAKNGSLLDPSGVLVADAAGGDSRPSLATGAGDHGFLLTWSNVSPDIKLNLLTAGLQTAAK